MEKDTGHDICLGGRGVIVTQCGKLLDGRHCCKWEEIQDMAYVWGGGLLVLSGENR